MPEHALTPDEVCTLLRECVVKPGETLAIRLARDVPAERVRELQQMANEMHRDAGWPRVWFLPGEEFGVVANAQFTDPAFGPFAPIQPVPIDEPPPDDPRPHPRRWDYPVGWGDGSDA